MGGRPLIIRTLDIGGDKQIGYLNNEKEDNPSLGFRAIRFCLGNPDVFMPQLSAILRAGADGNVLVMFPMITCKTELLGAKQMVRRAAEDLASRGIPHDSDMKIGMMIETPAAAVDAGIFAKEVDFFSIGTNDLSQFLFAADRTDARLTRLSSYYQPALLRVIKGIADAAFSEGIEVDICGQAAEIDELIPIWLAMGISNLSVNPPRIAAVRRRICSIKKSDCEPLLERVLLLETEDEVNKVLKEFSERNTI